MSVVSGSITLQVQLQDTLAAGSARLTSYAVPVQPTHQVAYSDGTAANQANKIYQSGGTASAAVVDIDLTAAVCTDGTVGFTKVRELIIFNDATTSTFILTTGAPAAISSTAFAPYLAGTNPTVDVQPGSPLRLSHPLGTTGWAVSGSAKIVRLDPGANNVAYRVIVVGN